jgi:glycosyltransferase involved in cell wall biosynthesis
MKILMVHNYTQQWGGADEATAQECTLLRSNGHLVQMFGRDNQDIKKYSFLEKVNLVFEPTWSWKSYHQIQEVIRTFKPDILHCQSFFPLVSPAIYYASSQLGVPVVQTLHEYRLICPGGWLLREEKPCHDCTKYSILSSIQHSCYRNSSLQTFPVAMMLGIHKAFKTWTRKIAVFTTPTEFSKQQFVTGGLPENKILVKSNLLASDPEYSSLPRSYAIYAGRLSPEKGIIPLLEAWRNLKHVPLKIVGDGPLEEWVKDYVKIHNMTQVEIVGFKPLAEVLKLLGQAYFLIQPSIAYETFGRAIMEAFATGTPALVSHSGAMAELVHDQNTGLLFEPNNANAITVAVQQAMTNPEQLNCWGLQARKVYEKQFSSMATYQCLMEIYNIAIAKSLEPTP